MNPFVRKSMSSLVIHPSLRALGQMQVKWQTFEKSENEETNVRQLGLGGPTTILLGFSNVCHSAAFWPTALKLGCITNFDMLSLVMRFIYLANEIQFILISSRHISNRSMGKVNKLHWKIIIILTCRVYIARLRMYIKTSKNRLLTAKFSKPILYTKLNN